MTEQAPPPATILGYPLAWLPGDLVAGLTLAAYAIPVSLAYATLAGLPPQVGIVGYLLGGLGYALAGSSRHLAVGPTSAISLMIAGSVGALAGDDAALYAQIASLAGFMVAILCLAAWLLRLSILVNLISDSVLTGFKAGAGITIAITQLPALFGTQGGGQNTPERLMALLAQLPLINVTTLALGVAALALVLAGERLLPGRPVALAAVILSIATVGLLNLGEHGVHIVGAIPPGLPEPRWPSLRLRDQEGIVPVAAGCLLLAYIEGVAAARAFAEKHGYTVDARRELLGLAAANAAAATCGGYPVAGGLSQSAVNEQAGAQSRLSLVVASLALAIGLIYLTGPLANLPKAALAAIVLAAVRGLVDFPALVHMWRVSRVDFLSALSALVGVLLLGILNGILTAVVVSALALLAFATRPHVAFLGRIPGTTRYSDTSRHPDNEPIPGIVAFRPEGSVLYLNVDHIRSEVLAHVDRPHAAPLRKVICDLSAAPLVDIPGARMLRDLANTLAARGIALSIVSSLGVVRDILRAEGLSHTVTGIVRGTTLEDEITEAGEARPPGPVA